MTQEEIDWQAFKQKVGIPDEYRWYPVSQEQSYAVEGHTQHGLTGEHLIKYVLLRVELSNIINEFKVQEKEIALLKSLKEKYPNI